MLVVHALLGLAVEVTLVGLGQLLAGHTEEPIVDIHECRHAASLHQQRPARPDVDGGRFGRRCPTVIGRMTDARLRLRPTLARMAVGPVQCPILVGRDELLDLADRVLAEATDGRGQTLLIAGEAGIGKTRLIRAIARKAVASGFRWDQGDLAPQDADVPLAVVRDLFRTMRSEPDDAPLAEVLLARCDEAAATGDTYTRTLVVELIERWRPSLERPRILVFEDLQWADDMSLELVGELARIAVRLPIVVIGAYRRDETPPGTPLRDWRARLLTQRFAQEYRLERLHREATGVMTTLLLNTGLPAPRDLVDAVHERSDGLPLHIEELVAATRAVGPVDVAAIRQADVPDTIEDAILGRASRRSAAAQAVAQAGAVLGRCFPPSLLAQVMDIPEQDLEMPLQELVDHGFLYDFGTVDAGYFDFRHQLLRDTLYRRTPDRDRRRYHARAGEFGAVLEGASEVHASLHFEQAGLREEAYRAARAGAEEAARMSAHREAFELYRRAVRNLPDDVPDRERGELLLSFAGEAGAIEENHISEEMATEARAAFLAAGDQLNAAMALSYVLTIWRREGRPLSQRQALIEQAMVEIAHTPEGADRESAAGFVGFDRLVCLVDSLQLDEARSYGSELLDLHDRVPDDGSLSAIRTRLAMVDVLAGDPDGGLAAMARLAAEARDAGWEATGVTAFRDTAVYAARVFDYPTVAASLAEGLVYADSIQQSHCAHIMAALVSEADWAAGRWSAAIPSGEQAMADRGCRRAPAMAGWALGFVALGRGEAERARALLEASRRFGDESEMVEWRLPPLWGLAEAALLDGRPTVAIELCETALALCIASGERALLAWFVVTGVRGYQAAARPSDAERWLARCAAHLAATPAFGRQALDHGAGLVSLAAGATSTARASLEAAVAGWDRAGRGWESWWARLDLATAHIRASRFAAAVAIASEVREIALALPSPSLLARADELLRHARGHVATDDPWRPLTAREFEVAQLIAEGNTNPEIADRLGISPKTASSHVEHILAKLGVARRAEIAAWAMTVERNSGQPTTR